MRRRQGVALLLGIAIATCTGIGAVHALDSSGTDSPTKENLDDRIVVSSDVNLPDTERQMRRDRSRGESTERERRRGRSRGEGPNCEGRRGLGRGENLNCDEGSGNGQTNGNQDGEDALNNTFPTFFSQVNESNLGFLPPRQKRAWAAFKIENMNLNDSSQATARRDAVELLLESLEPHIDRARVDSREAFDKSHQSLRRVNRLENENVTDVSSLAVLMSAEEMAEIAIRDAEFLVDVRGDEISRLDEVESHLREARNHLDEAEAKLKRGNLPTVIARANAVVEYGESWEDADSAMEIIEEDVPSEINISSATYDPKDGFIEVPLRGEVTAIRGHEIDNVAVMVNGEKHSEVPLFSSTSPLSRGTFKTTLELEQLDNVIEVEVSDGEQTDTDTYEFEAGGFGDEVFNETYVNEETGVVIEATGKGLSPDDVRTENRTFDDGYSVGPRVSVEASDNVINATVTTPIYDSVNISKANITFLKIEPETGETKFIEAKINEEERVASAEFDTFSVVTLIDFEDLSSGIGDRVQIGSDSKNLDDFLPLVDGDSDGIPDKVEKLSRDASFGQGVKALQAPPGSGQYLEEEAGKLNLDSEKNLTPDNIDSSLKDGEIVNIKWRVDNGLDLDDGGEPLGGTYLEAKVKDVIVHPDEGVTAADEKKTVRAGYEIPTFLANRTRDGELKLIKAWYLNSGDYIDGTNNKFAADSVAGEPDGYLMDIQKQSRRSGDIAGISDPDGDLFIRSHADAFLKSTPGAQIKEGDVELSFTSSSIERVEDNIITVNNGDNVPIEPKFSIEVLTKNKRGGFNKQNYIGLGALTYKIRLREVEGSREGFIQEVNNIPGRLEIKSRGDGYITVGAESEEGYGFVRKANINERMDGVVTQSSDEFTDMVATSGYISTSAAAIAGAAAGSGVKVALAGVEFIGNDIVIGEIIGASADGEVAAGIDKFAPSELESSEVFDGRIPEDINEDGFSDIVSPSSSFLEESENGVGGVVTSFTMEATNIESSSEREYGDPPLDAVSSLKNDVTITNESGNIKLMWDAGSKSVDPNGLNVNLLAQTDSEIKQDFDAEIVTSNTWGSGGTDTLVIRPDNKLREDGRIIDLEQLYVSLKHTKSQTLVYNDVKVMKEEFEIDIKDEDVTLTEGALYEPEVKVSNTGSVKGTQTITLDVEGDQKDSTQLTLEPGENKTINSTTSEELSWSTGGALEEGESQADFSVNVSSEDDFDTTEVTVKAIEEGELSGGFKLSREDVPSQVGPGETIELNIRVTNEANKTLTQTVLGGVGLGDTGFVANEKKTLTLAPGNSTVVTFGGIVPEFFSEEIRSDNTIRWGVTAVKKDPDGEFLVVTDQISGVIQVVRRVCRNPNNMGVSLFDFGGGSDRGTDSVIFQPLIAEEPPVTHEFRVSAFPTAGGADGPVSVLVQTQVGGVVVSGDTTSSGRVSLNVTDSGVRASATGDWRVTSSSGVSSSDFPVGIDTAAMEAVWNNPSIFDSGFVDVTVGDQEICAPVSG